jgi:hypothetical protein
MKKINLYLVIFCILNVILSGFSQVKAGVVPGSGVIGYAKSSQVVPEDSILKSYTIGIQRKAYYVLSDLSSQIEIQCVKSDRYYKQNLDSYEFLFVGTAIQEFSIFSIYLSVKKTDAC